MLKFQVIEMPDFYYLYPVIESSMCLDSTVVYAECPHCHLKNVLVATHTHTHVGITMRTLHRRNGFYTKLYHYNEIFYLLTLTPPLNINLSENFLRFYIFHLKKGKRHT